MLVKSKSETIANDDGVTQIAFDLTGSEAGYLLIVIPQHVESEEEFFGSDHYVEVKDQKFGRYGGLDQVRIRDDHKLELRLKQDIPGVGHQLDVLTNNAMAKGVRDILQKIVTG